MIQTHVNLTEEQARIIKRLAAAEKKDEAEVIRELLDQVLKSAAAHARETTGESLMRLAAIGGKGPKDLSARADEYLYGEKQ